MWVVLQSALAEKDVGKETGGAEREKEKEN
jgi:hypothetical protein